jgi:putative addiction module component (TIGR02574 family)
MRVEEIIEEARSLTAEDRARLVNSLLESYHRPSPEISAKWRETIDRRVQEIESGSVTGIPAEEVFAKVQRRFHRE